MMKTAEPETTQSRTAKSGEGATEETSDPKSTWRSVAAVSAAGLAASAGSTTLSSRIRPSTAASAAQIRHEKNCRIADERRRPPARNHGSASAERGDRLR